MFPCGGHKEGTCKLSRCHISGQVQSHGIPTVFEGTQPAVSCSRQFWPPIARSAVQGAKWPSRGTETSKGGPETTEPKCGYLCLRLPFLLSAEAGSVGTDSFLGQGLPPSCEAVQFLGWTTLTSSSDLEAARLLLSVVLRFCTRPGFSPPANISTC